MAAEGPGRLVRLSLDPVLMAAGFQEGQGGDDGADEVQVVFCASHGEFSRRHARLLPQASRDDEDAVCVDLVLEVGTDGTLGRLDLEGTSIEETLRRAGMAAHAEAVSQVLGQPVADSLPVLEAALRRLFADPD